MTGPAPDLAVIGLGNVLRGDDAIGVRVVEGLRAVVAGDPHALPAEHAARGWRHARPRPAALDPGRTSRRAR